MNFLPKDFTPQENLIADCLTNLGLRFEQQYEFFPYTADFFLPEISMVIEADGIYGHLNKRDAKRDLALKTTYQSEVTHVVHIKDLTQSKISAALIEALEKI
jgi:very-short-patch-repair endonuclease